MSAYARMAIGQFIRTDPSTVLGLLQQAYARDGFSSQYTRQTKAWARLIPQFLHMLAELVATRPESSDWTILLEYPLYRLRRRIDIVILAADVILVVECKVGAERFTAEDRRQVEEYGLDLRDFHHKSHGRRIIPLLWSSEAQRPPESFFIDSTCVAGHVEPVIHLDSTGMLAFLTVLAVADGGPAVHPEEWDRSEYRPVPNVIEAATSIFAGHDVRSIAKADADNLRSAASRLVTLIAEAKESRKRYLLILTGVPGSGKTLAGLDVVHSAIASGVERAGDIVYLSGNTPLVVVLREALALDQFSRSRHMGERITLGKVRLSVRARIQHINDFLQQSLLESTDSAPYEHVIVFDEAQRAWDEKRGIDKFDRTASEPALLLDLMSRHRDWCVCVCLIGSGQEINSGEDGVRGWGDALRKLDPTLRKEWTVFGPPGVLDNSLDANPQTLGNLGSDIVTTVDSALELVVPQRSFRSPSLSRWVDFVLSGEVERANDAAQRLNAYPLRLTRSLSCAKRWLEREGRGERRFGLIASSGARRLRADGLGEMLDASAGNEIAQWYLKPRGDIRSSFALEVPANEYTCQGLELDFTCVCWGGDLLWDPRLGTWIFSRLAGSSWQRIRSQPAQQFLMNSYRVLLTRAREGTVLWVPVGDELDKTRPSKPLNDTADFLSRCGVQALDS
jgi:hypothetical protein